MDGPNGTSDPSPSIVALHNFASPVDGTAALTSLNLEQAAQPQRQFTTTTTTQAHFSGPIPPPGLLRDYDAISPGLADRLVSMAEGEARHRRELESRIVEAQIRDNKIRLDETRRGQLFAFVIVIAAIIGATIAAYSGHEVSAGILGGVPITGVVTTFILGRSKAPQDEKQQQGKESNNAKKRKRRAT